MPSYELPPQPADLQTWVDALTSEAEAIRRDIAAKRQILERIDERLSLAKQLVELEQPGPPNGAEATPTARTSPSAPATRSDGSSLEDEVELILAEAGSPLHISMIRGLLIERGVSIPGRGDDANIIVRLTKDGERFNRTARGTYALKAWGLPTMRSAQRGKRNKAKR